MRCAPKLLVIGINACLSVGTVGPVVAICITGSNYSAQAAGGFGSSDVSEAGGSSGGVSLPPLKTPKLAAASRPTAATPMISPYSATGPSASPISCLRLAWAARGIAVVAAAAALERSAERRRSSDMVGAEAVRPAVTPAAADGRGDGVNATAAQQRTDNIYSESV